MSRRDVLKLGGVVAGAGTLGLSTLLSDPAEGSPVADVVGADHPLRARLTWPPRQVLPTFAMPTHLDVVDLTAADGDTQTLLTTLQGVVNRRKPRIYLVLQSDGTDESWLKTIGVPYTRHADPLSLVRLYRREITGTVVWDPDVLDTINVATSLAGLTDAVVASPALAETLAASPYNLLISEDLRGRFADKFAAYGWALDELWPRLTHRILTAVSPSQTVPTPGVTWTTLAKVTQPVHDSSNEGTYTIDLAGQLGGDSVYVRFADAYSDEGWGPSVSQVTVVADGTTLADFQPTTAGETPYVYDLDGSSIASGGWRFADGTSYFIYQFTPPAGTTKLSMEVTMWNQYFIQGTDTAPEQTVGFPNLRDYIVATNALVFWLDPQVTEEAALFATILAETEPNTPYLGWFVGGHETYGVTLCAQNSVPILASDYFNNASVFGGVLSVVRSHQPRAAVPDLENKIYVTLLLDEGDNLQYDQHELRLRWDDPARGEVPLNWTIDPMLLEAAPSMLGYYQRTQTANDLLVAGPSGAGYTYPDEWPPSTIDLYTQRTGRYLKRTGMDVIYALNRDDDTNVATLSDATAKSYVDHVHGLLGLFYNWESAGAVTTAAGTLPIVTVAGCNAVSDMQNALDTAQASWDGTSPLFIGLGVETFDLGPTDCAPFVRGLGADFEVVRADVFMKLLRRSLEK